MSAVRDVLCGVWEQRCVTFDIFWQHEGEADWCGGEIIQESAPDEVSGREDCEDIECHRCCDGGQPKDQAEEYCLSGIWLGDGIV